MQQRQDDRLRSAAPIAVIAAVAAITAAESSGLQDASFSSRAANSLNTDRSHVQVSSSSPVQNAKYFISAGLNNLVSRPAELTAFAPTSPDQYPSDARVAQVLQAAISSGLISEEMRQSINQNPNNKVKYGAIAVLTEIEARPDLISALTARREMFANNLLESSLITDAEIKQVRAFPLASMYNLPDVLSTNGDMDKVERRELYTALDIYRTWGNSNFKYYFNEEAGHVSELTALQNATLNERVLSAVALNYKAQELNLTGASLNESSDALSRTLAEVRNLSKK